MAAGDGTCLGHDEAVAWELGKKLETGATRGDGVKGSARVTLTETVSRLPPGFPPPPTHTNLTAGRGRIGLVGS